MNSSLSNLSSTKEALDRVKQEMLHLQSEVQHLGSELVTIKEAISSARNIDDLHRKLSEHV